MKNIQLSFICFLSFMSLMFISCSNDNEDVYDEVLSNTTWHQFYINPQDEVAEEPFEIPDYILERLEFTTYSEEAKDTVFNVQQTNEYILTFGSDETCELNDIHHFVGTYQIETYEEEVTYYPNQTYREDVGGGYTTEIIVYNGSLTLRSLKGEELVRQNTMFLGKNNEIRRKGRTIDVSEPSDYEVEDKAETYHMTYTRNGNRLELAGDKNLSGVISEDFSEIEFKEIGTFGIYK